jgi:dihydrodipicolinate synthase/N-acetylneuraminate lyase
MAAQRRIVGGVVRSSALASADGRGAAVQGVCPVLASPFDDRGAIDVEGFAGLVGHVLDSGVTSVMWPGFASESYKVCDSELAAMRTCLLEQVRIRGCRAVFSVSRHATRLAVEDAVAAAEAGADAVSILPPYFLSPSRDAVLEHLHAVVAAVAPLAVIVQYAPALAPAGIDSADLARLAARHENFRTVKVDTAPACAVITSLLAGQPSLDVMVGYAGIEMIDSLRRGAYGVQPGCSFVEIYQRIWQLWAAGHIERAARLHDRLLPYLTGWMAEMELIIQIEKTISKQRGWIRSDHCRAPGRRLTADENATVFRFLEEFADLLAPVSDRGAGRVMDVQQF